MGFLVFKGTAEATGDNTDFPRGAIHGYMCVATHEELQAALNAASREAQEFGFTIKTVDGEPMSIPAWFSWLPTKQGRALREAKTLGVILTLSREMGDPMNAGESG